MIPSRFSLQFTRARGTRPIRSPGTADKGRYAYWHIPDSATRGMLSRSIQATVALPKSSVETNRLE